MTGLDLQKLNLAAFSLNNSGDVQKIQKNAQLLFVLRGSGGGFGQQGQCSILINRRECNSGNQSLANPSVPEALAQFTGSGLGVPFVRSQKSDDIGRRQKK